MEKLPSDLNKILTSNPKAKAKWGDLTPIARRDFISWLEGAKQQATRKRRLERVPSMLLSGKRRPCCYAIVPMNLYTALNSNPKAKANWKNLTPDERRDFIGFVDKAENKDKSKSRIDEVCNILAKGARRL